MSAFPRRVALIALAAVLSTLSCAAIASWHAPTRAAATASPNDSQWG